MIRALIGLVIILIWGCTDSSDYHYLFVEGKHGGGPYRSKALCEIELADIAMKFKMSGRPMPHIECRKSINV